MRTSPWHGPDLKHRQYFVLIFKKIPTIAGYQFAQQNVPGQFNFGAPVTSPFGK
jgi:hypothetical protein